MPRMELVVPAVGTVAYQLVSTPRMGSSSTFVSSAVSFAGRRKKCNQRHNHSNLHICKIRQDEG